MLFRSRLYLFRSSGKRYLRLSDEFNVESKGKIDATFDVPDAYANILSFDEMLTYDEDTKKITNYAGRSLSELGTISKNDSRKLNM